MLVHDVPQKWSTKPGRRVNLSRWCLAACTIGLTFLMLSTLAQVDQVDDTLTHGWTSSSAHGRWTKRSWGSPQTPSEKSHIGHSQEILPTADEVDGTVLQPTNPDAFERTDLEKHPSWLHAPDTAAFPAFSKYAATVERAQSLPDLVYIPFEDAIRDDVLAGWEAEWVMNGTYDIEKWGLLPEPRIDFVYTCKYHSLPGSADFSAHTIRRGQRVRCGVLVHKTAL